MTLRPLDYERALALEPEAMPVPDAPRVSVVPARSPLRNSERPSAIPQTAPQRMVDVFLRYLKEEGVRHVFAIPGGLLHPLMAAVEADALLTLVMPKHEEGAAFMADGYARATGKLALCAGTSGPGATNLV